MDSMLMMNINRLRSQSSLLSTTICLLLAMVVLSSCGMINRADLRKRAEGYYAAWKFKDYSSMYFYLNNWGQQQITEEEFAQFFSMLDSGKAIYSPDDLEADYLRNMNTGGIETFKIEEVRITNGSGRVRVFLKTKKDLIGETVVDPNSWILEDGQWRIELTAQSTLYKNIQQWLKKTAPAPEPDEAAKAKIQQQEVSLVRKTINEIASQIERYAQENGKYPTTLSELQGGNLFLDPYCNSGEFRYASDGVTFWIVASNGPDSKPDIDVTRFNGFRNGYPPPDLVYEPSTGKGDLYNYGPK